MFIPVYRYSDFVCIFMHNIQIVNDSNSMIAFSLNSSCYSSFSSHFVYIVVLNARKLCTKGTPDFHLSYSKNGEIRD